MIVFRYELFFALINLNLESVQLPERWGVKGNPAKRGHVKEAHIYLHPSKSRDGGF
jgi:hypothetical protein